MAHLIRRNLSCAGWASFQSYPSSILHVPHSVGSASCAEAPSSQGQVPLDVIQWDVHVTFTVRIGVQRRDVILDAVTDRIARVLVPEICGEPEKNKRTGGGLHLKDRRQSDNLSESISITLTCHCS